MFFMCYSNVNGVTIMLRLNIGRIHHACKLLRETAMPVTEQKEGRIKCKRSSFKIVFTHTQ